VWKVGFFSRIRKLLAPALTVVVLVTLMAVTARERERISRLEEVLVEGLAPVQRALYSGAEALGSGVRSLAGWRNLKRDNARLQAEVGSLTALAEQARETVEENRRLRRLLGFAETLPFDYLAAHVIARNADNWFSTVLIDLGRRDGVAKNMPVVTPPGLVGRVITVTSDTATVLLTSDPDSGVGAMIRRSRDCGVLLGEMGGQGALTMRFFSRQASVREGDIVITSGLGILPKGLLLGTVRRVRTSEQGLLIEADVEPATDLGRLEEVLVLMRPHPDYIDVLERGNEPAAHPPPLVDMRDLQ
jgi:rod shape-determining protein MreC